MASHETDQFRERAALVNTHNSSGASALRTYNSVDHTEDTSPAHRTAATNDSNMATEPQWKPPITLDRISVPVYVLVMLFAISSWIDVNGLWVELPLLVNQLPEGWNLPSYLVIIIQIANIGPLMYTLGHHIAPSKITEVPVIYIIICIGAIASILLVYFWDVTSHFLGSEHSTALLTLTAFLSLVDCTSSVVFLPYMQRLGIRYMSALYIGEGLSGLIPGFVGLAQGVGGNPQCVNTSTVIHNSTTGTNTTNWAVYPVYPPPKFSVEVFFWFIFLMLCVSGIAFTLINYLPYCKRVAHVETPFTDSTKCITDDPGYEAVNQDEENRLQYSSIHENKKEFERLSTGEVSDEQRSSSTEGSEVRTYKHLWYLLLLTAWLNALTNGVLPSTQTYSCLPYGHLAYTLTVRLSTIANPLACFLVLFLQPVSIAGLSALIAVATTLSAYLLYLAALSPAPPLQGHVLGVTLVILSSVLMTAIFSYCKVVIAVILRREGGHRALLWCGVFTQAGSLCGALVTFLIVNVFKLLQTMDPCAA